VVFASKSAGLVNFDVKHNAPINIDNEEKDVFAKFDRI
jgi:hypothetical protein